MRGSYQLAVVFAFAAMIAAFCLCVAYLAGLVLGQSFAGLVGLATLFSLIVFSVSMSVVRMIKRCALLAGVER